MKTRTKKLTLAALLAVVMLMSCALGGMLAFADGETPGGSAAPGWVVTEGVTATKDNDTNMWHVEGIHTGAYASYNQKVELNGLKVTFKPCATGSNTVVSFGLTSEPNVNPYVGDNLVASYVVGLYTSQTRFGFFTGNTLATMLPTNGSTFLRKTLEMAKDDTKGTPFPKADTYVLNYPDENVSTEMTFSYLSTDEVWQVNFHFNFTSSFQGSASDITAYFNKKYVDSILDTDGKCYITACAGSQSNTTPTDAYYKIEDAYDLVTKPAVEEKMSAYEGLVANITDITSLRTALDKREECRIAIASLRVSDFPAYEGRFNVCEQAYLGNSVQPFLRNMAEEYFTDANSKVELLSDANNISHANIDAATKACNDAKKLCDSMSAILTESNRNYFASLYTEYMATIEEAKNNKPKWEDAEWVKGSGAPYAEYEPTEEMSHVYINTYAASMTYKYKVKLEGLKVYMEVGKMSETERHMFGFGFSDLPNCNTDNFPWKLENAFCATFWSHQHAAQTRLHIGNTHNIDNGTYIAYKDPGLTDGALGVASSFVYNYPGVASVTLEFHFDSEHDVWAVDFSAPNSASWGSNVSRFYFDKQYVNSVLDANGELYVVVMGQIAAGLNYADGYIKIEDDNSKDYKAGAYAQAEAAATAYGDAIRAINDSATYEASRAARTALEEKIAVLRGNDKLVFAQRIAEIDKLYTEDETVQGLVAGVLETYFSATDSLVAVFADEANINDQSILAAANARNIEKGHYDDMKSMLTKANQDSFKARRSNHLYAIEHAQAKLWVKTYEKMAADLATAADTALLDAIVEIKAYKADYAGSEAERLITTRLEDGDKEALETRIAATDAAVAQIEAENAPAVKEHYLLDFEDSVETDLSVKFNIDEAKNRYQFLMGKVSITADDGELYTRFTAAYNKLKAACEAYLKTELEGVKESLKTQYTSYNEFKPLLARYKALSLGYLMEENQEIATIYNEVTELMETEPFYYVTATQLGDVANNKTGLYFEQTPSYPSRLNYNQELDLTKGVEIVVELSEIAYYNDGTRANNLVFNFLSEKNSYKGMSDGISIMIWLYSQECNIWILNYTDIAIETSILTTPMEGSNLTIRIKYESYYDFVADEEYMAYVISVNNVEIALTRDRLTANGHNVSDVCYFSMGSFADDTTNPNCLTLVSVNGKSLAVADKSQEDPEQPTKPGDDNEPGDGNNNDNNNSNNNDNNRKKKCGSSVAATFGSVAIVLIAAVAVMLIRRRKYTA